jgi:hypothetical protein
MALMLLNLYSMSLTKSLNKIVFTPDLPFQENVMFEFKARAYLSEHLSDACLYGRLLALLTNIRLG